MSELAWHELSAADVVAALKSDADQGLPQAEAERRLKEHGKNELDTEKPTPGWKKFRTQFKDMLVVLLLVATGISFALWLHERESALPYEAIAIFSVVLLNAVMGFLQEARAEKAVAALKRMAAAHATVIRNGERKSIASDEVVPGDVLLLEEGNTVPADARLLEVTALQTAEAALTGESLPVSKEVEAVEGDVPLGDRINSLFSGTAVTYGHGKAVAVATGMQTQMGRIAGVLRTTLNEPTPLQRELTRLGRRLGIVVIAIALVMMGTIIVIENVRGAAALFDVLILGVALAVAAVPEGLPAVVTAVLSLGVQRMANRNAIVRRLTAVEALGSANVIASDKTGTLTKNEMTVRAVVTASGKVVFEGTGYAPEGAVSREGGAAIDGALKRELERALAVADRANNAELQEREGRWFVQGDPTEGALLVAARKARLDPAALERRFIRVGEVPFSSQRKLMSTIHSDAECKDRVLVFTKGAADVLLGRCRAELLGHEKRPLTPQRRAEISQASEDLARQALRVIAVAMRELPAATFDPTSPLAHVEQELVFAGLIGMIDPPREEAKGAVARAHAAGIRVLMITGDHPETAKVIARELGISSDGPVMRGPELEKMTETQLTEAVREISVYARVNPAHKLRIVKSLQADGAIVAMTGDGVNDAPALKTADIGIAMGIAGTDVSKEAADIVLADDNFASIVAAVEEGRAIFSNIRKFLRYLLGSNIGEVMTMFFGVVLADVIGLEHPEGGAVVLPLLATQMLWVNLATDGAPALALGVDPADEGVMQRPPRPGEERVVTRKMWFGILLTGFVTAIGTLLVLDASMRDGLIEGHGDLRYGQTRAFTTLVCFSLFTVFTSRSDDRSAFRGLFVNGWLWGAVLLSAALQVAVVYVPFLQAGFGTTALAAGDWLVCIAVASSVLWVRELDKLIARVAREARRRADEPST
jgi:Ca2+-transporting ATPase